MLILSHDQLTISTGKKLLNTDINEKVSVFNKRILNVLKNYIPYETIICDDKCPLWFNSQIKSLTENRISFAKFIEGLNRIVTY